MPTTFQRSARALLRKSLPFWLILPTLLVLAVVQVWPGVYTIWLSLHQREPGGWVYVGGGNYARLLRMGLFTESVGHTVVFLASYAAITLAAGLLIALLLNRKPRFSGLYLTLIYIPWVIADLVAGLVFRLLAAPDYGLLSAITQNPRLFPPDGLSILTAPPPPAWIDGFPFPPTPAMVYLILASAWRAVPFVTLLLLASLQTIAQETIESARIDGARAWQLVLYIRLPLMLPTLVVALFSLTLSGMNGVGMIFALTGGGPGTSTEVLSYLLYSLGWRQLEFGRAAALAMIMALVNWVLILGILRATRIEERAN